MGEFLVSMLLSWLYGLGAWAVHSLGWGGIAVAVATVVVTLALAAKGVRFLGKPRVIVFLAMVGIAGLLWWAGSTPMPDGRRRFDGGLPSVRQGGDAIQASRQKTQDKPHASSKVRPNSDLSAIMPGVGGGSVMGSSSGFIQPVVPPPVPIPHIGIVTIPPSHHTASKPGQHAKPEGGHALAARAPAAAAHAGQAAGVPGLGHLAQGAVSSAGNATPKPASPPSDMGSMAHATPAGGNNIQTPASPHAGMGGTVQGQPPNGGMGSSMTFAQQRNAERWAKFREDQRRWAEIEPDFNAMQHLLMGNGMPHIGPGHVSGGRGHPSGGAHHPAAKQHHP